MTLPSSPKKVVVLALPGARELDLASVLDVFTQANWQLAPNPVYQVEVVTSDAKGRVDRDDRPSISRERALLRLHGRNRHAVDRRRSKFGEE